MYEDGSGLGYIAFPKSQVPFGASNARGGHYFVESATPRAPKSGKSNLASKHFDLVEAASGTVVRAHAAWIWDPSNVNDTSPANAYPHLNGKSPLGNIVGIEEYAFKTWYEEAEHMIPGGHVKDPYHRVDTVLTDRHVQVYSLDGDLLADSKNAHICFETGFVDRYYFDKKDVLDQNTLSKELTPLKTVCPYKGEASYYNGMYFLRDRLPSTMMLTSLADIVSSHAPVGQSLRKPSLDISKSARRGRETRRTHRILGTRSQLQACR